MTPLNRSDEVSWAAMKDGLMSGTLTIIPTYGMLQLGLKNKKFVQSTNWQSRTALVIMPALFMFAYTAEQKLAHKMKELASEEEHKHSTVKWAEKKHKEEQEKQQMARPSIKIDPNMDTEQQLTQLYRQSVVESGVRVVPSLGPHHAIANYWQENPFKILAIAGIPTVAYIFHGRSQKNHLQLQSQLMHTRVFGQFAVIVMLLSLMGFKEYMDTNGKFITEAEASRRVEEMRLVREDLQRKLQEEKQHKASIAKQMEEAHQRDLAEGRIQNKSKKKKKKAVNAIEGI